ncbi:pyridoxamine 5'-phosphate oxidase family protein [Pseudomonas aeruginosa]|nr:pyridoxamine 5'-phosphate oxidase family protein [Pseudomonas aeruginosa]
MDGSWRGTERVSRSASSIPSRLSQVHPGAQPSARLQDRKSRICRAKDSIHAGCRWSPRSDTLFIASQHADPLRGGVDVSHRGGPGLSPARRGWPPPWLPDYAGNRLFNTLGNLLRDPRCGLLFIDFDNGDLLHLHAEAELFWPGSQPSIPWPAGAGRLRGVAPRRLALAAWPPAAGIRRAPAILSSSR